MKGAEQYYANHFRPKPAAELERQKESEIAATTLETTAEARAAIQSIARVAVENDVVVPIDVEQHLSLIREGHARQLRKRKL